MIEKFFIQTNDTIWHFLSEIGKDKDVFSTHSGMEIDGYIIYFFATKTEVVLLCMDNPYHEDGTPEYADKGVCRISPIVIYPSTMISIWKVLHTGPNGKRTSETEAISTGQTGAMMTGHHPQTRDTAGNPKKVTSSQMSSRSACKSFPRIIGAVFMESP